MTASSPSVDGALRRLSTSVNARLPFPSLALRLQAATIRQGIQHITTMVTHEKPPPRLAMRLSVRGLRIGWSIVLFFHVFSALYTLGLAYIYSFLRRGDMEYYVEAIQMLPQRYFTWITVVYACISALNFKCTLEMVVYSALYRQLTFGKMTFGGAKIVDASFTPPPQKQRTWWRRLCCGCGCLFAISKFLARVGQAIGVRGHLFDAVLMTREVIEVASQTYQAHSSSLLVSKRWVNQLFGLLVFLNCVANTAVHVFKEEETGMRRFLCIAIDLFLDFAWGFIFPGNILFDYLPTFIAHDYSLPSEFYYSDTLFIKAILDCRQFFMVSIADAVTTTLPYVNMFYGLRNMKVLLQLKADQELSTRTLRLRQRRANVVLVAHAETPRETEERAAVGGPDPVAGPSSEALNSQRSMDSARSSAAAQAPALRKWMFAIIPLFGTAVLTTSIVASGALSRADPCGHGCKLRMRPWFSTHCACSVMEVNCYERGLAGGSAQELTDVLSSLDRRVLNSLIVTHCAALEMPSALREFPGLLGVEFYNVTFHKWTKDAALSRPFLPRVGHVYVTRSTMHELPDGLTHDITDSLIDIEFSASTIGSFPWELIHKWSHVLLLYVEFCGLQTFPAALAALPVTDLSLVGNNISSLPDNLTQPHEWLYLYLDRNPLTVLPDDLGDISRLQLLTIQSTNISRLPSYLSEHHDEMPSFKIAAFDSLLCQQQDDNTSQAPSFVVCDYPNPFVWNGVFSLQSKDLQRLIVPNAAVPTDIPWLSEPL
ncbi:hypothetical protein PINS_up001475 [Pythium insidiosum]|nr:hypothetical protein PINS_up001475 [Pythium insidiosum]